MGSHAWVWDDLRTGVYSVTLHISGSGASGLIARAEDGDGEAGPGGNAARGLIAMHGPDEGGAPKGGLRIGGSGAGGLIASVGEVCPSIARPSTGGSRRRKLWLQLHRPRACAAPGWLHVIEPREKRGGAPPCAAAGSSMGFVCSQSRVAADQWPSRALNASRIESTRLNAPQAQK